MAGFLGPVQARREQLRMASLREESEDAAIAFQMKQNRREQREFEAGQREMKELLQETRKFLKSEDVLEHLNHAEEKHPDQDDLLLQMREIYADRMLKEALSMETGQFLEVGQRLGWQKHGRAPCL